MNNIKLNHKLFALTTREHNSIIDCNWSKQGVQFSVGSHILFSGVNNCHILNYVPSNLCMWQKNISRREVFDIGLRWCMHCFSVQCVYVIRTFRILYFQGVITPWYFYLSRVLHFCLHREWCYFSFYLPCYLNACIISALSA